jgi:catechol 2,3-dioxygenase-like lactoylglutathione lyase family enzyme
VERATGIGGVFVRSTNPEALRAWDAEHLGLELQGFGGAVLTSSGGETLTWAVFEGNTDYFGSRVQQVMVNYRVRDLDAMLAQLRAAGASVEEHVEEHEYGHFGWATDADGNRFELWEPAAGQ